MENEAVFRLIFERANDATFVIDRTTELLVAANRRASELFGYEPEVLCTKTIYQLLHPESAARVPEVREKLDRGQTTPYEMICLRSNGELRTIEASSCTVSLNGRPATLAIYRDITERKAIEAALAAQTARLERINADLSAFAAAAAHDLKAPLQTMSGFSQLLERSLGPALEGTARAHLASITDGSRRMAKLIEDLLEYARHETEISSVEVVDANSVLDEALLHLRAAIHESGATVVRGPMRCVRVARPHLLQIFQNLIGNALKFRRAEVETRVGISATLDGAVVRFRVEDNGIGVPDLQRNRIFQPFVRLERRQVQGSGLGLATCQRIVERYGGRIWIDDSTSLGTAFCFELPAGAARPRLTAVPSTPDRAAHLQ